MTMQLAAAAATGLIPMPSEIAIIVDDDAVVRDSIDSLLRSVGLATHAYASALEMLDDPVPESPACVITDIRMPRLGGLEFQSRLNAQPRPLPIVFITGHGDIPMSVRAMKAGAVDFLQKPFRDQELLDAVTAAIERDRHQLMQQYDRGRLRSRLDQLTPREHEVMAGVVRGLLNKQIAGELGLSEITVKLHRSSMMRKLELKSVAALVRLADRMAASA